MTTRNTELVRCGHCGRESEHDMILSTNRFGHPDLDLRPPEMMRSTMDAWLQACPHCGLVAPSIAPRPADPEVLAGAPYRAALADDRFSPLGRRFLAYAVRRETAGDDPDGAAHAFLQAAWASDDDRRPDAAAEARRRAASHLRRAAPTDGDPAAAAARGAVLVDALRRAGAFDEAADACAGLLAAAHVTGPLRDALLYQQQLVADRDAAAHTFGDAAAGASRRQIERA